MKKENIKKVVLAYSGGLDTSIIIPWLKENYNNWQLPNWVSQELNKISHRTYSTGFYFGRPENSQTYENAGYIRDYSVAAVVDGYEDGKIIATLKNKFLRGQEFDCLEAGSVPFNITATELYNEKNEAIDSAPHPMMKIKIPFIRQAFLRLPPQRSIPKEIIFSNTAKMVENAAKDIKTKNKLPHNLPSDILLKILGNVRKIRFGPLLTSTP